MSTDKLFKKRYQSRSDAYAISAANQDMVLAQDENADPVERMIVTDGEADHGAKHSQLMDRISPAVNHIMAADFSGSTVTQIAEHKVAEAEQIVADETFESEQRQQKRERLETQKRNLVIQGVPENGPAIRAGAVQSGVIKATAEGITASAFSFLTQSVDGGLIGALGFCLLMCAVMLAMAWFQGDYLLRVALNRDSSIFSRALHGLGALLITVAIGYVIFVFSDMRASTHSGENTDLYANGFLLITTALYASMLQGFAKTPAHNNDMKKVLRDLSDLAVLERQSIQRARRNVRQMIAEGHGVVDNHVSRKGPELKGVNKALVQCAKEAGKFKVSRDSDQARCADLCGLHRTTVIGTMPPHLKNTIPSHYFRRRDLSDVFTKELEVEPLQRMAERHRGDFSDMQLAVTAAHSVLDRAQTRLLNRLNRSTADEQTAATLPPPA